METKPSFQLSVAAGMTLPVRIWNWNGNTTQLTTNIRGNNKFWFKWIRFVVVLFHGNSFKLKTYLLDNLMAYHG
jgi:hypothetical protein